MYKVLDIGSKVHLPPDFAQALSFEERPSKSSVMMLGGTFVGAFSWTEPCTADQRSRCSLTFMFIAFLLEGDNQFLFAPEAIKVKTVI